MYRCKWLEDLWAPLESDMLLRGGRATVLDQLPREVHNGKDYAVVRYEGGSVFLPLEGVEVFYTGRSPQPEDLDTLTDSYAMAMSLPRTPRIEAAVAA